MYSEDKRITKHCLVLHLILKRKCEEELVAWRCLCIIFNYLQCRLRHEALGYLFCGPCQSTLDMDMQETYSLIFVASLRVVFFWSSSPVLRFSLVGSHGKYRGAKRIVTYPLLTCRLNQKLPSQVWCYQGSRLTIWGNPDRLKMRSKTIRSNQKQKRSYLFECAISNQ